MITLYGSSTGRPSRCLFALEELGSPYRHVPLRPWERAEDVEYFLYLQWLAADQLAAAQREAREAGMSIGLYGDVAVVLMLITQNATVGQPPRDRSAQFLITDIWVRQKDGWRVTERHSSRPEQPPQATTAPPR